MSSRKRFKVMVNYRQLILNSSKGSHTLRVIKQSKRLRGMQEENLEGATGKRGEMYVRQCL
jgi:hypothetical protein